MASSTSATPREVQSHDEKHGQAQHRKLLSQPDDQPDHTPSQRRKSAASMPHWRVPTFMISALLSGTLFAVGHHLFYNSHDGEDVRGSMGQQWVIRIGTAFAFLVTTFLAAAAGSAYVQRQWYKLGRKEYRIADVDSLFGILGDATFFFDRVWFRDVLLALLAVATWLLPFAAVVTPGSIVVEPTAHVQSMMLKVPQYSYNFSNYAVVEGAGGNGFLGSSTELGRIAVAAATSGQVLQIPSAYPNESYVLDFFAPAIKCELDNQVRDTMTKATIIGPDNHSDKQYLFASWIADDTIRGALGTPPYDFNTIGDWETIGGGVNQSIDSRLQLHVLAYPGVAPSGGNAEVYQCLFHNASYRASFNFQYPLQDVKAKSVDLHEPLEVATTLGVANLIDRGQDAGTIEIMSRSLAYAGMIDAFGSVMVGAARHSQYGANTLLGGTRYAQTKIDWTNVNTTINTIERLFQNITLSMLSSSQLTKNLSTALPINTTVLTYPNKYVYDPRSLWLPYGIAIGVTMICMGFGFEAILRNKTTYSNRFSTILRTTRNADFDLLVDKTDDGADPLPKRIARAMLSHEGRNEMNVRRRRR